MMKKFASMVALAAFTLASSTSVLAQDFDADAAKGLFETKCSRCHSIDRPASKKKSREGWTKTVNRMKGKSPSWIADADAEAIIEHLSRTYGK